MNEKYNTWFNWSHVKCTLAFVILAVVLPLSAQEVPDIAVTDTDGNEHDLYADYLDKGRTVLVGIFFSSCPPCQRMAPDLQLLYEEWGEGNGDVEFIKLSNKSWETDATAGNYKERFDLSFPVVSNDGGSLAAWNALLDADLGSFFSTPLYIVIAPDGSAVWDVSGIGTAGTIEKLDEELTKTGAEKPGSTGSVTPADIALELFPNPVRNLLHIPGARYAEMHSLLEIRSADGSLVRRVELDGVSGRAFRIDVGDLPEGAYTALLRSDTHNKSAIFIKL